MITPSEKKEMIAFVKKLFPVGRAVYDPVRGSTPYYIKKTSVFEVFEDDYSEEMKPDKDEDIYVSFYVRDRGSTTPRYDLKCYPKRWILKKYNERIH